MSITCPVCLKDDQIKKLLSIYHQGTVTSSFSGTAVGVTYDDGKLNPSVTGIYGSGHSVTELARLLPPPRKPPTVNSASPVLWLALVGFLIFWCGSALWTTDSSYIFVSIVGLIVLLYGFIVGIRKTKSRAPEVKKINDEANAEFLRKKVIYDRLYYCDRDFICFDPDSKEFRPVMDTWQLFNQ